MFNANTKVNFKVETARKSEKFALAWEGQLTTEAPLTKQALKNELMCDFLYEVNHPRDEQTKYRPEEIRVSLSVA